MEERKEPTFVKFADGETVDGVLISIQKMMVGQPPKPATRYTIMDIDSKELHCFLGTYQIDTKLRPADKGHYISVTCEGNEPGVIRNGNPMKRFKIRVSNQTVLEALGGNSQVDSTFITDDDIPF
jgi:hypothetical protein